MTSVCWITASGRFDLFSDGGVGYSSSVGSAIYLLITKSMFSSSLIVSRRLRQRDLRGPLVATGEVSSMIKAGHPPHHACLFVSSKRGRFQVIVLRLPTTG